MKSYKNVELFAKNAPFGAYAAGCPTHHKDYGGAIEDERGRAVGYDCSICEVAN